MAYERKKELNATTTIRLSQKGEQVEGYYMGSKKVPSKYGESTLHVFETPEGENLGVWGSGRMNYGLASLAPVNGKAAMVRVTCKGTIPSKKGNPAYDFDFEIDRKRLTTAPDAPIDSAEDQVPVSSSYEAVSDEAYVPEEEEVIIPPSRVTSNPVSAASANQVRTVSSLLNNRTRR